VTGPVRNSRAAQGMPSCSWLAVSETWADNWRPGVPGTAGGWCDLCPGQRRSNTCNTCNYSDTLPSKAVRAVRGIRGSGARLRTPTWPTRTAALVAVPGTLPRAGGGDRPRAARPGRAGRRRCGAAACRAARRDTRRGVCRAGTSRLVPSSPWSACPATGRPAAPGRLQSHPARARFPVTGPGRAEPAAAESQAVQPPVR